MLGTLAVMHQGRIEVINAICRVKSMPVKGPNLAAARDAGSQPATFRPILPLSVALNSLRCVRRYPILLSNPYEIRSQNKPAIVP